MSKLWLSPLLCVSLLSASACAAAGGDAPKSNDKAKDDSGVKTSGVADGGELASPKLIVKLAIASVQMIQDCPDPPEPEPTPAADSPAPSQPMDQERAPSAAEGASRRRGGGDFVQPCDQSTIQLTLQVDGDAAQTVRIAAIRLLDKQGEPVGELSSRKPSAWVDQAYAPWDEAVAPGAELKASYKLSLPDWSAVEKAIGETSFGYMFKLEIDVEIGGELETVQSPEFPREQPNVIVT